VGVYTQSDKPAGRGRQLTPSAVKRWAAEKGLPVVQPRTLRDPAALAHLTELAPEVIVVAAYGLILPRAVIELPPRGCINIHASLLPKYRGAAPIRAALLNGETRTGITLMRMDEGVDTGPMLAQAELAIAPRETAGTLTAKLAELGARMLDDILPRWLAGEITPQTQDHSQATFAPKLAKDDERLDWTRSAVELDRRVRALTPTPGTYTTWNGKLLRVITAQVAGSATHAAAGQVVKDGKHIGVTTSAGILHLAEIQPEGKRVMPAADFARGQPAFIGSILGS
jgi:methionyl-tRNA formyltransferase